MGIRRLMFKISEIPGWARRKTKSLKLGFAVDDTYSLDYSMAKWFTPRLKYFKENLHSYPPNMTPEEWDEILEEMYIGFEMMTRKYDDFLNSEEDFAIMKRSVELFSQHYFDLWD